MKNAYLKSKTQRFWIDYVESASDPIETIAFTCLEQADTDKEFIESFSKALSELRTECFEIQIEADIVKVI